MQGKGTAEIIQFLFLFEAIMLEEEKSKERIA